MVVFLHTILGQSSTCSWGLSPSQSPPSPSPSPSLSLLCHDIIIFPTQLHLLTISASPFLCFVRFHSPSLNPAQKTRKTKKSPNPLCRKIKSTSPERKDLILATNLEDMNAVADQDQDMGDGMQCSDHPYRSNPGGICAFCLQEKLGKLVSSSFPLPIHAPATSSSSSPSFRSDIINGGNGAAGHSSSAASLALSLSVHPTSSSSVKPRSIGSNYHHEDEFYNTRRARISFLLAKKKKKVSDGAATTGTGAATVVSSDREAANMVFKRSKSTTNPRRGHHFLDGSEDFSPRKRGGFWSFLYHSSTKNSSHALNKKTMDKSSFRDNSTSKISSSLTSAQKDSKSFGSSSLRNRSELAVDADDDSNSPNSSQATAASASSFERKVSRSRSVGCGSRSFSGDFFERISTGFGDCTLRRVESQREGGRDERRSGNGER